MSKRPIPWKWIGFSATVVTAGVVGVLIGYEVDFLAFTAGLMITAAWALRSVPPPAAEAKAPDVGPEKWEKELANMRSELRPMMKAWSDTIEAVRELKAPQDVDPRVLRVNAELEKRVGDAFGKIERTFANEFRSRDQQLRTIQSQFEQLRNAVEALQEEVLIAQAKQEPKAMAAAAAAQPGVTPMARKPVVAPRPPPSPAANGEWWDIPVHGTTAQDWIGYRYLLLEGLRLIPPDAKLVKLRMDGSLVEVADLKVDEKRMILIGPHGELGNREYYQTFLAQQAGDRLQIAMPRCRFNIDNSPTVLAALVEGHPPEPKQIESVERPAELIRDRNGQYKIQTRMKLRFAS